MSLHVGGRGPGHLVRVPLGAVTPPPSSAGSPIGLLLILTKAS